MPVCGADKRKLYKLLSFERKAAERKLRVKIKGCEGVKHALVAIEARDRIRHSPSRRAHSSEWSSSHAR